MQGNSSLYKDLTDAICLLTSLTQVAPTSHPLSDPIGTGSKSLGCKDTVDVDYSQDDPVDSEAGKFGDHFEADSEDARLRRLKDMLVDRLAEILARFKSSPKSGNQDAKHVSSVILIEHAGNDGITFICAKNNGLDEQDKEDFLPKWKNLMERASQSGKGVSTLVSRAHDLT
ncbi:hypothetical protein BFJ71_g16289 [Fusarium oxysporum]|nr:hypothetical protein BFJ71_g16289 [Fusarium oxysporum]